MDYLEACIIPGDMLFMIPDASLFHFGVLMSNVHMAWMRAICGRMKSDYRYSNSVTCNNFPWPTPTEAQKTKIEQTAKAILDLCRRICGKPTKPMTGRSWQPMDSMWGA